MHNFDKDIFIKIKIKDTKYFISKYESKGLYSVINDIGEYINEANYFSISSTGDIVEKDLNLAIPLLWAIEDANYKDVIKLIIEKYTHFNKRIPVKKINRLSNLSMEKLESNFFKLLSNGNLNFSLRYSKEILLRDKYKFFHLLKRYTLMDDIYNGKSLLALAFEEIYNDQLNKNDHDKLIYSIIKYISLKRSNFSSYILLNKKPKIKDIKLLNLKENVNNLRNISGIYFLGSYFNTININNIEKDLFYEKLSLNFNKINKTNKGFSIETDLIYNKLIKMLP